MTDMTLFPARLVALIASFVTVELITRAPPVWRILVQTVIIGALTGAVFYFGGRFIRQYVLKEAKHAESKPDSPTG